MRKAVVLLSVFLCACGLFKNNNIPEDIDSSEGSQIGGKPNAPINEEQNAQPAWEFKSVGTLQDPNGVGFSENRNYLPGIRFPLEQAPAFANSQVFGVGGMNGPAGSQCNTANYNYPWWDTFCESRSRSSSLCKTGKGHQGLDIRPSTCKDAIHWAVAAEDGVITHIGSYTVFLRGKHTRNTYRYMHLKMDRLSVKRFDTVKRGQKLGLVSNDFGKTKTTIHLHFDVQQSVQLSNGEVETVYVPPYTALTNAYGRLLKGEP